MLLINGISAIQSELKTLGINPAESCSRSSTTKRDPGNGYTKTLLRIVQLFIVSIQTDTYCFAKNNDCCFGFDAEKNFLPIYQQTAAV